MSETVLLTGATGFVGSHLAERLAGLGARLRCVVRRTSDHRALAGLGAEILYGSLADRGALEDACRGCSTVYHCAGVTKAVSNLEFFEANADGTGTLVEALRAAAPRALLVHVSSLAAAGPSPTGTPLTEEDPASPVSIYGRSKLAAESVVRSSGLRWVIARPPAVYGPRDTDVFSLFKLASLGLSPVVGGLERTLSLVHASDLAAGLALAARALPGSVYYLCDRRPYALDEVMGEIARALGRKSLARVNVPWALVRPAAALSERWGRLRGRPMIFNTDKLRELSAAHWVCSPAKAEAELGFFAGASLEERVASTAEWYRSRGWLR